MADHNDNQGKGEDKGHKDLITVKIDGNDKEIEKGEYVVSDLKVALGVAADRVLEIVKEHGLETLEDNQTIHVHNGEKFASHVRGGGSSWS